MSDNFYRDLLGKIRSPEVREIMRNTVTKTSVRELNPPLDARLVKADERISQARKARLASSVK